MSRLRAQLVSWLPPIVAGVILVVAWETVLAITDPDGFVLPRPTEILSALDENWSPIREAAQNTGWIIVSGAIFGVAIGTVAALLVTRFRTAAETLTPLAIAVNAIPIIALAPVFNAWFGITSPRSNQAVVAALTFFPVFINTAKGLTEVAPSQIELMRSYAASEWRITREVRIPNALPFWFTALRIVSSLAVIAAIVAEYFGGRRDALGQFILQNAGNTRYDDAWAAVFVAAAIGIAIYAVVVVVERLVMPWHASVRASTD